MNKATFRHYLPDVAIVVAFLLVSFLYFASPISQGMVLGGHDTVAGIGGGHELTEHYAATGETSRWTGALFSGMPTYQISPSYSSGTILSWIGRAIGLFTHGAMGYLFMYLLGFYLLMRAFAVRPLASALGAVAWAFSSYFLIIIAAGHLWKVATLGFIPPTIAGMVLCYRGRYWVGGAMTALFTALQVQANHPQMTYYFLFLMAFIVVCFAVSAFLPQSSDHDCNALIPKKRSTFLRATAVIVVAGLMGIVANSPSLYHTWQYQHASTRGGSALTATPESTTPSERAATGLDRDYITAWSYGIDETLTLLIPDFKGGGSRSILEREDVQTLDGYNTFYQDASMLQQIYTEQGQQGPMPGLSEYWGDQPFTVGPVYVGAIICFLFILGLCLVEGPMKWALVLATVVSLLFAWGKNIMPLTDWLIDHLPMYNKFRTVSSALVVAEFTMPLLAVLALVKVLRRPDVLLGTRRGKVGLIAATVLTLGLCLLLAVCPDMANNISTADINDLAALQSAGLPADFCESYRTAILSMHADILSHSALRSAMLIGVALLTLLAYTRGIIKQAWVVCTVLIVACLGDLWSIDKRYLNDTSFTDPVQQQQAFAKTPADDTILADKTVGFRVVNLSGNPFNETSNQTAYWHRNVGGYHPAKLQRYQDLIDRHLGAECQRLAGALLQAQSSLAADSASGGDPIAALQAIVAQSPIDTIAPMLCMLNTRYIILGSGQLALANPSASGAAWFVQRLTYAAGADAEMQALGSLDWQHAAVADKSEQGILGEARATDAGSVVMTSYAPNELHYTTTSTTGGVVVLSEIYYPGWTATLDGKPVEIGRANYLLRALRVPAGQHEVVLTFRPSTVSTTEAVATAAIGLILIALAYGLWRTWRRRKA